MKSHKNFVALLSETTTEFLNTESRNASAVQASLNHAIGDCDQFIRLLQLRMKKCPDDKKEDREYHTKSLASTKAIKNAITQSYADRIEELTKITNRNSLPPSVSGSKHPSPHKGSKRGPSSKAGTNHSRTTSSSKRSQQTREARARLEEIRAEEEHEEQMLKEREELARRKLQRKKEEIRLQQTIQESQSDSSEDSSSSERDFETCTSRTKSTGRNRLRNSKQNASDVNFPPRPDTSPNHTGLGNYGSSLNPAVDAFLPTRSQQTGISRNKKSTYIVMTSSLHRLHPVLRVLSILQSQGPLKSSCTSKLWKGENQSMMDVLCPIFPSRMTSAC